MLLKYYYLNSVDRNLDVNYNLCQGVMMSLIKDYPRPKKIACSKTSEVIGYIYSEYRYNGIIEKDHRCCPHAHSSVTQSLYANTLSLGELLTY